MPSIPTLRLSNGVDMPALAFGTGTAWFLAKMNPGNAFNTDLVAMIKAAIAAGYRHLDCSEYYGTEAELGQAIRESGVARDEFFIVTKVRDGVRNVDAALTRSLERLGLDYVDLYLVHEPWHELRGEPTAIQETWRAMETAQRSGRARAIGVSNFLKPHVEAVLEIAEIRPVLNQLEFHPYLQRGDDLIAWLLEQAIQPVAFFGLVPITHGKGGPLDGPIKRIADAHGVSESAVLFRWALERGVASLTTTMKEGRMAEYLQVLDLRLAKEEVEEISRVGNQHHFRTWFTEEFKPDDRR